MTISWRALFGKLSLTLFPGIESATAFTRLRGHPYVEPMHRIHQLWQLNDIPARQFPDKAISLLDTACARVATSLHALPPMVGKRAETAALGRNSARRELAAQAVKWREELAAVREIHALGMHEGERSRGSEKEAGCAEGETPSAQLIALKQALLARQQDAVQSRPPVRGG